MQAKHKAKTSPNTSNYMYMDNRTKYYGFNKVTKSYPQSFTLLCLASKTSHQSTHTGTSEMIHITAKKFCDLLAVEGTVIT